MNVALDTNRYTDFCRNDRKSVDVVEHASRVIIPLIVIAELRAGFALGKRGKENERVLRRFLQSDGVAVIAPDDQTTFHYAAVYRQLRTQGTPIPTNDIWIAAIVIQHNLSLFARDAHFDHLPQIPRV